MPKIEVIGCMDNSLDHTFESANRVYSTNGITPTINTCGGGGLQPKIMEMVKIKKNTKTGYSLCEIWGGGRLDLSKKLNSQRKGNRERKDMSDSNDGEYP